MRRVAIMQPYFFPYVGYFELIAAVDLFLFLTDVQYIRRGWVNRNRIRNGDGWQYVTVPVVKCPRETKIKNVKIAGDWKKPVLTALRSKFKKAERHELYQIIDWEGGSVLSPMLCRTVVLTANHLGIKTKFAEAEPCDGTGQELIINLCKRHGATTYVNLPGGRDLYDEKLFADAGIDLQFMPPTEFPNKYSILDVCLGGESLPPLPGA